MQGVQAYRCYLNLHKQLQHTYPPLSLAGSQILSQLLECRCPGRHGSPKQLFAKSMWKRSLQWRMYLMKALQRFTFPLMIHPKIKMWMSECRRQSLRWCFLQSGTTTFVWGECIRSWPELESCHVLRTKSVQSSLQVCLRFIWSRPS